jgi:hypothetical protein
MTDHPSSVKDAPTSRTARTGGRWFHGADPMMQQGRSWATWTVTPMVGESPRRSTGADGYATLVHCPDPEDETGGAAEELCAEL